MTLSGVQTTVTVMYDVRTMLVRFSEETKCNSRQQNTPFCLLLQLHSLAEIHQLSELSCPNCEVNRRGELRLESPRRVVRYIFFYQRQTEISYIPTRCLKLNGTVLTCKGRDTTPVCLWLRVVHPLAALNAS